MAIRKYVDKEGLKVLVHKVKEHVNDKIEEKIVGLYKINGSAIYIPDSTIDTVHVKEGIYKGAFVPTTKEQAEALVPVIVKDEAISSTFKTGTVFNVQNNFTTFSDLFTEGQNVKIKAGTNIVIIDDGGTLKADIFATSFVTDLTPYQTKELVEKLVFSRALNNYSSVDDLESVSITEELIGAINTVTVDSANNKKDIYVFADINTRTKIGDNYTVEGALSALTYIANNTELIIKLNKYQEKNLSVDVTFNNELYAKSFNSTSELPSTYADVTGYELVDGDIVHVISTNDIYQCSFAGYPNTEPISTTAISWAKIGNTKTVEGNLSILNAIALNKIVTKAEIEALFA